MSFHNVSSINTVGSYSTVVRTLDSYTKIKQEQFILYLRSRESILRPAKRMSILIKKSILLLDAEPWVGIGSLLHHFKAEFAVIGVCGFLVVLVGFTHDKDIVAPSEWIRIHLNWL